MAAVRGLILVVALWAAAALVQPMRSSGACNFTSPPKIPYFWDPSCPQKWTSLGCLADGVNPQCRFCGEGAYSEVFCPAYWCTFDNPPHIPYYWDSRCSMGRIGCLADGKHVQCRYCGEYPYNGTVQCPEQAHAITPRHRCEFDNEPKTPYFWDATCKESMLGCKADGKHISCRFCGAGAYAPVRCPATLCTFKPEAAHKHYWEPQCWNDSSHILGCLADGIHPQCRYCGSREYKNISCPA